MTRLMTATLLLGFLLLPAAGGAQPAPDQDDVDSLKSFDRMRAMRQSAIRIDSALLGTGAHPCDVTEPIRKQCDTHDRCELEIDKALCPVKALPGMILPLKVSYRCRTGEALRVVHAEESQRLRLTCPKDH
jgi:hypothetical protein